MSPATPDNVMLFLGLFCIAQSQCNPILGTADKPLFESAPRSIMIAKYRSMIVVRTQNDGGPLRVIAAAERSTCYAVRRQ